MRHRVPEIVGNGQRLPPLALRYLRHDHAHRGGFRMRAGFGEAGELRQPFEVAAGGEDQR